MESIPVKDKTIIDGNDKQEKLEGIKDKFPTARISIRKSGTENKIRMMVESKDKNQISDVMGHLKSLIK